MLAFDSLLAHHVHLLLPRPRSFLFGRYVLCSGSCQITLVITFHLISFWLGIWFLRCISPCVTLLGLKFIYTPSLSQSVWLFLFMVLLWPFSLVSSWTISSVSSLAFNVLYWLKLKYLLESIDCRNCSSFRLSICIPPTLTSAEWHSPGCCSESESCVSLFVTKPEATFLTFRRLIFDGEPVQLLTPGHWLFSIYWPSDPDPSTFSIGISSSSESLWMAHGTISPRLFLYPRNSNGLSPSSNLSLQWLIKTSTSPATIFNGSLMLNPSGRVSGAINKSLLLWKSAQGKCLWTSFPAEMPVKCQGWDFQEEC